MPNSIKIIFLCAFMALGIFASSATASGGEICTSSGKCEVISATFVEGTTVSAGAGSHSASSAEASAFSKVEAKKKIVEWERTNKRKIAVRMKPNGIKGSRKCMDPVIQGLIKSGGTFVNTSANDPDGFYDTWIAGWKICHYREVTIGGKKYLIGTKGNCGNKRIKIPLHFKIKTKYKVVPSVEVKTYKEFWFKIWLPSQASSKSESGSSAGSTATTGDHYTCPAGWEMVAGNKCKRCPPPHCEEPPEEPESFVQVDCQSPEHVYANENPGEDNKVFMYCITRNHNGKEIAVEATSNNTSIATIGSRKSVSVRNQAGDPCPSGAQCFRFTVTAGNTPGVAHLTVIAKSNGDENEWKGTVKVEEDDFGE